MSLLAITSKGLYAMGVSMAINTTYVKSGGGKGDTVNVNSKVISMGKTLAFTRMEIRHPVAVALLAYGSHTKFIGKASGHPENIKFDEDGEQVLEGKQPEEWPQQ